MAPEEPEKKTGFAHGSPRKKRARSGIMFLYVPPEALESEKKNSAFGAVGAEGAVFFPAPKAPAAPQAPVAPQEPLIVKASPEGLAPRMNSNIFKGEYICIFHPKHTMHGPHGKHAACNI